MKKGILVALVILLGLALLAACGGKKEPLPPIPEGTQVAMRNFAFDPATLTIERGTTVIWGNYDSVRHDVVGEGFKSGLFGKGRYFSHTFSEPGTYSIICGIHPFMTSEIIVR